MVVRLCLAAARTGQPELAHQPAGLVPADVDLVATQRGPDAGHGGKLLRSYPQISPGVCG